MLLALTILTNCSSALEAFGIESRTATYEVLGAKLPTASRQDTAQTRREIGEFRVLFIGLCQSQVPNPDVTCGGANGPL